MSTGMDLVLAIYENLYQGTINPDEVQTRYRDAYLLYQELQQNYHPKIAYKLLIAAWDLAIKDAHEGREE
ncbi:MAG: hypothetical protein WCD86_18700 [Ktedonobacteraceae bacterium]